MGSQEHGARSVLGNYPLWVPVTQVACPGLGDTDTYLLVVHPQHIIKIVLFCIIFN